MEKLERKEDLSIFLDRFKPVLYEALETGKVNLTEEKKKVCDSLKMDRIPKNGEIMACLEPVEASYFSHILRSKPVRTASGVSVVAVMTRPFDCPHGTCLFCPGGTRFGTPQSYTGEEPAARRAALSGYDPYKQTIARLKHYVFMGYSPEKVEVIVIGGTFTSLPNDYKEYFVENVYRALNNFNATETKKGDLDNEKKMNESAYSRCVTFAIETKPERCGAEDIKQLIRFGVTRVEMGVQSVFNDVLSRNNRGHSIEDVKDSTKRLRDNAYKVDYHIMLNLPFSDIDKDRESIRQIYEDEDLRPDAIKIYPTLVIKGTGLYNLWKEGRYKAYPKEEVINIIAEAEIKAPKWLRIMRIQRDIPSNKVEDGIKMTNLRQLVDERLRLSGKYPSDIRSREIGHVAIKKQPDIRINRYQYRAAGGDEIFLAAEDENNDAIVGFLRLRMKDNSSEGMVRELHVYGEQLPLSISSAEGFQHRGWGRSLLNSAENIVRSEYSRRKIRIISGVGVRGYYKKLGYILDKEYMVKYI